MKNHCQSPLNCLRQLNTYTLPPSHPVVIIATVHAAAATLLPSRNQIHIENTVNPTYRSTRETTPQGLESSQVICSPKLPVVADIAQAMTTNMTREPIAVTTKPVRTPREFLGCDDHIP